jgi:hypothetical protein
MEEEKKEVEKPAEAIAAPEPAAPAPATEAKPQAATDAPKPGEAKKKEEAKKVEKPANCVACNKSIKKKRWYYRDGKYYCSKECWQTAAKKAKAPEAPAAAQ